MLQLKNTMSLSNIMIVLMMNCPIGSSLGENWDSIQIVWEEENWDIINRNIDGDYWRSF